VQRDLGLTDRLGVGVLVRIEWMLEQQWLVARSLWWNGYVLHLPSVSSLANNSPLGRLGEQRLQNGEFRLNKWRMFLGLLLEFGKIRGWDEGIGTGVFQFARG
jgi:hypothetical protein